MQAERWLTLPAEAARLAPGEKIHIDGRASGRRLLLLRDRDGSLSCLDAFCFHQGADLSTGEVMDIESLGAVVRCPRHGRCVVAKTGVWVEDSGSGWCSHGAVQRVYPVRLDAAGNVQVRLDAAEGSRLPSDLYNRSSPPRVLPAGGGGGTIAWQSRKRCAEPPCHGST